MPETELTAHVSMVRASNAARAGILMFRRNARNFKPACAMAGEVF